MSQTVEARLARSHHTPSSPDDELIRRLARVAARCCEGDATVIARDARPFIDALRARGRHASSSSLEGSDAAIPDGLACAIIAITDPEDAVLLEDAIRRAWAWLPERGRLIVATPNAEADRDPGPGRFREKDIRRVLEPLGRPKLVSEQPFAWLMMRIDRKPAAGRNRASRSAIERFEAIASLCRGSVVELGCGAGSLAAAIHARGHTVVGVDLNAPKIDHARSCFEDIEFIAADICRPDLLEGRLFDTVVLAEVLEHVPEDVGTRMLSGARRLLRPGGRVIISVPNRNCIPHRNHIRVFDRKALKALLSTFGHPRTVARQPYKWLLMYADAHA